MNTYKRTSTTSERLKIALDIRGMKQADLVRMTGIDKGALSSYVKGTYEPKQKAIYLLSCALNVDEMWLWGYDVEMDRKPESSIPCCSLSSSEEDLLSMFRELNEEGQNALLEYCEFIFSKNEYKKNSDVRENA